MTRAHRPLALGLTLLITGCAENEKKITSGFTKDKIGERKLIRTTAYTD
jgi:hypothetical protein